MHRTISIVALLMTAAPALAAPIFYGNFSGTNVDFLNVQEDSSTDPGPLFGAPVVAADSLAFSPVSFGADANMGNGYVDITDGTMATTIKAKPGKVINHVTVNESGDYTLTGAGPGTVSVAATLFVQIVEIGGTPVNPVVINGSLVFTPSGNPATVAGDYALPGNAGVGTVWTGTGTLDIDAALASRGISGQATKVLFSMNNTLVSIGSPGTVAFIKKKTNGVTIVVPEPASLGMLLGGAIVLLRRR
jgi:hypothetical protein